MKRLQAKQIQKLLAAPIRINELNANSGSLVITSEITTALTTAGFNNNPIILQNSTDESISGIILNGLNNKVEIWDSNTKNKLGGDGKEIYGKINHSSGIYTLFFYTLISGVETAYSFVSATDIDIEFNYRYEFKDLPTDAFLPKNINQDFSSSGSLITEELNVTDLNIISNLTQTPNINNNIEVIVNGQVFNYVGSSLPFTISGLTITWLPAIAGFDLETTDKIIAKYYKI